MIIATIKFNCPGTNTTNGTAKTIVTDNSWFCQERPAFTQGSKNNAFWTPNLDDYLNLIDSTAYYIWSNNNDPAFIDTAEEIICSYTIPDLACKIS